MSSLSFGFQQRNATPTKLSKDLLDDTAKRLIDDTKRSSETKTNKLKFNATHNKRTYNS